MLLWITVTAKVQTYGTGFGQSILQAVKVRELDVTKSFRPVISIFDNLYAFDLTGE